MSYGQSPDLLLHEEFFKDNKEEINLWLQNSNIPSNLLLVSDVVVEEHLVKVSLISKSSKNINSLDSAMLDRESKDFMQIFFDQVLFLTDLKPHQLKVEISTPKELIKLTSKNGELHTQRLLRQGGNIEDLNIATDNVDVVGIRGIIKSDMAIKDVKDRLKNELNKNYSGYKAFWYWNKYTFDSYGTKYKLTIEISNISNVLLDKKYFEFLKMVFDISKQKDKTVVSYTLYTKYASGILFSPFSSDYHYTHLYYPEQFKSYEPKFESIIYNIMSYE